MALELPVGPSRLRASDADRERVVAVAAARVVTQPAKGQSPPTVKLEVRGLLLGVQRADGTLVAPTATLTVSRRAKGEAERVGRAALTDDPWLAYSGRQAAAAAMAFERGPGTPRHAPLQPDTAGPPSPRIGVPRRDPLESWREWVGDRRAERIGERAGELRDQLKGLDDIQLLALRRKVTAALKPPDLAMARQALSLEQDVTRLEVSVTEARRNVAALQAGDATQPRGRARARSAGAAGRPARGWTRARHRRLAALKAAAVIQDRIVVEESARDRLLRTDDRLPARNRLDAWMNGHTGQAAQLVAVDRHLSERLHSRIAGEVDRAVLDPPDFVCTAHRERAGAVRARARRVGGADLDACARPPCRRGEPRSRLRAATTRSARAARTRRARAEPARTTRA